MMKKIFLVFILFLGSLGLFAQQPVDSIYVWVNITDDRIFIDIPESYFNHRTVLPPLPSFVAVRKLSMVVPELPGHEKLIAMLTSELQSNDQIKKHQEQLNYLQKVALFLYFSNNNVSLLPQKAKDYIPNWLPDAEIGKETALISNWLIWGK